MHFRFISVNTVTLTENEFLNWFIKFVVTFSIWQKKKIDNIQQHLKRNKVLCCHFWTRFQKVPKKNVRRHCCSVRAWRSEETRTIMNECPKIPKFFWPENTARGRSTCLRLTFGKQQRAKGAGGSAENVALKISAAAKQLLINSGKRYWAVHDAGSVQTHTDIPAPLP